MGTAARRSVRRAARRAKACRPAKDDLESVLDTEILLCVNHSGEAYPAMRHRMGSTANTAVQQAQA